MKNNIELAKKLIVAQVEMGFVNQSIDFLKYNKVYPWTNENVNAYLDLVDFQGKDSALTVLASGDQAFNLLKYGIKNIDTFDINPLTEYYALGLKRAMILKYDYMSFISIIKRLYNPWCNVEIIHGLIRNLFSYMEPEHRTFWETIIEYDYKVQKCAHTNLNLVLMLVLDMFNLSQIGLNSFMNSEDNYNSIKSKLMNANINFRSVNAIDLAEEYKGKKYDLIMMSNILDYFHQFLGENWTYSEFTKYKEKLETLAKKDAILFLHYIVCYLKNGEKYRDSIINKADIIESDLEKEELVVLPGDFIIDSGLILSRVKK